MLITTTQVHFTHFYLLLNYKRPVMKITQISYIFNPLQLNFFGTGKYTHKLCDFQECAGRRVVIMKKPVVAAPKFRSFLYHISSQESRNVTVKLRVDHSVRRNKFTVNNPLHIKKHNEHALCWTPDLLLVIVGSSTSTIVALFLDHNHKSNFHHPLWSLR
jgi:hypothetical protein